MNLCAAIASKRLISFTYDGHQRVIVPAAHGHHITTGRAVLRGYQIRGTGNSRTVPFWDLFLIEKVSNLSLLEEFFDTYPPHYKPGDKHIAPICCEL